MVTTEAFWSQMGAYNEATLPVQVVVMVVAVVLTYLVFARPDSRASTLMKLLLSLTFAWTGVVYFLIFTSGIPSMFSVLFLIVAMLFAVDIFEKKTEFALPAAGWQRYPTVFLILLVFLYPVIGMALGHSYPETCMPMAPCPLTVFAIALVTAAIPRVDRKVYIFLLPWGIMALPKCLGALDCHEDCILLGAGIYGLALLVRNWEAIGALPGDR